MRKLTTNVRIFKTLIRKVVINMTISAIGQGLSLLSLLGPKKPNAGDMASKIMGKLDTDGDGSLSTDEIGKAGKFASKLLSADTNGDGIVTEDELIDDITKKTNSEAMSFMALLKPPSADELASQIIKALDADGDGALSKNEISNGGDLAQKILKADTNGDGIVTSNELVTDIQKNMASRHAGMHRSGAGGDDSSKSTDPADANKDGVVTTAELIAYLSQTLMGSQTTESQLDSLA
jgi:Ca2+-binding EF-hand superfamily protein